MTDITQVIDGSSLVSLAYDDALCIALIGIRLDNDMICERVGILCTQIDCFLPSVQWQETAQSIVDAYNSIVKLQSLYGLIGTANRLEHGLYPSLA